MTPFLDLVRSVVEAHGFELVDLQQSGTPARPVLKVRADRAESAPGQGVTTEDCVMLSRAIERSLEATAAVGPTYVLEVSSPGIERPIRFPEHWRRFVGRRATVRTARLAGRPSVEIVAVPDEESVEVRLPGGEQVRLLLKDIREARLIYEWPASGKKK